MNVTEYLIQCLSEECVEIAKDCSKANRFGLDDVNFLEPEGPTNREKILNELNDLVATIQMLEDFEIIPTMWIKQELVEAKKQKIKNMMEYSHKEGALQCDQGQMKIHHFNFRHVMDRIGLSLANPKRNQVVGRLLDRWAQDNGITKIRPLTDKTDNNPSVNAPHCICAYPMQFLDSAIDYIKSCALDGDDALQLQLFT